MAKLTPKQLKSQKKKAARAEHKATKEIFIINTRPTKYTRYYSIISCKFITTS
jgi:hypothetical protein